MSGAIILLRPDDTFAAASLHAACFDEHGQWTARDMRETLSLPTTLAIGIDGGDGLDGLALIQRVVPDAEILTICVRPDQRRHGLAQKMFDHACGLLGQYGVERLLLDVAADNQPAISFYERNGFARDGIRKNYYQRSGGQPVDAVLMSRNLAGQNAKSKA